MINSNNQYTKMQRGHYNNISHEMLKHNHRQHDLNPDYHGLLLRQIVDHPDKFKDKIALDFGCGCGRNIFNMINLAPFTRVDGCDISEVNIRNTKIFLKQEGINEEKFNLYITDGISLNGIEDNIYDFVMSTIVFQHICVHDIRYSLLKDIYKVMKEDGLFSFQIARYNRKIERNLVNYFDNKWDAPHTNGRWDVCVDNPQDLVGELTELGFKNIFYEIRPEWDFKNEKYFDNGNEWIFVTCNK